ncbi:hypothetical protein ABGB11_29760 [Actinomadura sp. B10D3]
MNDAKGGASPAEVDVGGLAVEFLGWTVEVVQDPPVWRASRDVAPPLVIAAGSVVELRTLLDEADRFDCRRATHALAEVLRGRGVIAQVYGQAIVAESPCGVRRTIVAGRGLYRWTSGVVIGAIGEVAGAAERALRGLGAS